MPITVFTRRDRHPYAVPVFSGYIRVQDGAGVWITSTHVRRLSRADALADAEALREQLLDQSDLIRTRTNPNH